MSSDSLFQQRYCRLLESNILSYCELLVGGLAVLHATGDVGTRNVTRRECSIRYHSRREKLAYCSVSFWLYPEADLADTSH